MLELHEQPWLVRLGNQRLGPGSDREAGPARWCGEGVCVSCEEVPRSSGARGAAPCLRGRSGTRGPSDRVLLLALGCAERFHHAFRGAARSPRPPLVASRRGRARGLPLLLPPHRMPAAGWACLLFRGVGLRMGQRRVRGFACRAAPVRLTQRAVDSCSPLMPADCDALRPLCCSDSSTTSNLRGKNRSKVNDGTLSFFQESGFRKLD